MTEVLQTRAEHSRSLADAEKYQAFETLQDLGVLIPVASLEPFHGRKGSAKETMPWAVDPMFANGGNDSGNYNVNSRPTLYTAEHQTAKDFAIARAQEDVRSRLHKHLVNRVENYTPEEKQAWFQREKEELQKRASDDSIIRRDPGTFRPEHLSAYREVQRLKHEMPEDEKKALWKELQGDLRAEVHKVVSTDPDATVLNFEFDVAKLNEEDTKKYHEALRALVIPMTAGSPVAFEDRGKPLAFADAVRALALDGGVLAIDDLDQLAEKSGLDHELVEQLAGSYNALRFAFLKPTYLASRFLKHRVDIVTDSITRGEERIDIPLNLEYAQRYFKENHIVGVRDPINSATLNRRAISFSLFDLHKMGSEPQIAYQREQMQQHLGSTAESIGKLLLPEVQPSSLFMRYLENPHVRPEELVEAARSVGRFDEVFSMQTGNWEGYTLAEHTATVLRNFDENYADALPVSLLAPMRLAIVAHDLGKPQAALPDAKKSQKQYNEQYAQEFFQELGINEQLSKPLTAMIGDGEDLAYAVHIRGQNAAAFRDFAKATLVDAFPKTDIIEQDIRGFMTLCSILQLCDGGAYTSMAVTRSLDGSGTYRNAPSFNGSFSRPTDLGQRHIRRRRGDDESAPRDMKPRRAKQESRVRFGGGGAGRKAPIVKSGK